MTSDLVFELIILALLWLLLFAGAVIMGLTRSDKHLQNEPEPEPCDTCLRWSECHAVDAEICPHFPKGGRPDA